MGLFTRGSKESTNRKARKAGETAPSVGVGKVGWDDVNAQSYDFLKRDGGPISLVSAAKIVRPSLFDLFVVGGEPTGAHEFQEVVAVGDETEYWASGILIGRRYVLTAGHVHSLGGRLRVSIGPEASPSALCQGVTPPKPSPEEIEVGPSVRHPGFWDEPFFTHDLAVLKLKRCPRRTRGISLDGLATAEEFNDAKVGRLVGYGKANDTGTTDSETDGTGTTGFGTRRKVDVPIVHHKDLRRPHRFEEEQNYDKRFEFVAAAPLLDKDACSGDSGGGFYIRSSFRWKLAGMVSRQFGLYGSHCGAGSIYLRLYQYRSCIQAMIAYLNKKIDHDALTSVCCKYEKPPQSSSARCCGCGCLGLPWRLLRG